MATTVARLEAVLSADTRHFDTGMNRSEKTMHKVGRAATIFGTVLAAGVAGGAVIAVRNASNLHEQINKVDVVFGDSANAVQEWSKTTAKSLGTSRREALEAAGVFGNMLKPMGLAVPLAAKMSVQMVKLGGDMASFNNASPQETLEALRAGLAGQARPLRRFGVFLDANRIAAEALSLGLVKANVSTDKVRAAQIKATLAAKDYTVAVRAHGKGSDEALTAEAHLATASETLKKALAGTKVELTAAQKAQATYSIITKDTADAQGDFARTSGGLANQQRILRAQFEDITAELGTKLLPVITKVLSKVIAFINFLGAHPKTAKLFAIGLGAVAAAFIAVAIASGAATLAASPWIAAVAGIILAVAGLAAGLVYAYTHFRTFRNTVDDAIRVVKILWSVFKLTPLGLVITHIRELADAFRAVWKAIEHSTRALKSFIDKLVSLKGPSGIDIVKGIAGAFGDAEPNMAQLVVGTGPPSVSPRLYDELAGAQARGLVLTSGYRPGARTKHGTRSDHSYYPSHAIDVAGPAANMASFFRWLIGQRDVKQAFYDPLGSIFNGVLSSYREGGHSDHVHVATYDKGGWLMPGLTLAQNWTGRPERVGGDGGNVTIPIYIAGEHVATLLFDKLRNRAKVFERRNSRPAFGT